MATSTSTMLPGPQVQARYGISGRTLNRWKYDPDMGFPQPITINHRDYYDERALEAWERQRAATSRKTSTRTRSSEPAQSAA